MLTHSQDWQSSYGQASLSYFNAFASQLDRAGFKNDDMLQEGFQEGVSKNEISLVVVDKLEKGGYHELAINDGVLYIRVPADKWWVNGKFDLPQRVACADRYQSMRPVPRS